MSRTRSASTIGVFFILDIHSLFIRLTAGTGREKEIRFKFEEGECMNQCSSKLAENHKSNYFKDRIITN